MLKKLKTALEQRAGIKLDSVKACRRMEQILYEKGFFVSYTTLSRIFGIAKKVAVPRNETLNLLSRFLDYNSYDLFISLQSRIESEEETFVVKLLELKSYLLTGQYLTAIDLMDEIRNLSRDKYIFCAKDLGKAIFEKKENNVKVLDYLLEKDFSPLDFHKIFVHEDDPYGQFRKSLEILNVNGLKSDERQIFESYFKGRKKILAGEKVKKIEAVDENYDFELHSRFLEIEILNDKSNERIADIIQNILKICSENNDEAIKLAYIGRACRGLLYKGNYKLLEAHEEWKKCCIQIFNSGIKNLEFKAPIFTFLKLVYGERMPLDFYLDYHPNNIQIESQLILSMAFDTKNAIANYKKILGIKIKL